MPSTVSSEIPVTAAATASIDASRSRGSVLQCLLLVELLHLVAGHHGVERLLALLARARYLV